MLARLASRQRKKRHTEDLEQQQKDFGKSLESLQAQNEALQLERQSQDQNYQILSHRFQEAQRIIDSMHDEKRDLIMKHTEETSSLRKRIRVLTDQLDHGPTPALSAEPSSGGFADFNAEMEALNMGPHDWDSLIFVNDLGSDSLDDITFDTKSNQVRHSPLLDRSDTSALTLPASAKRPPEGAAEQNVTSGLLFFLLLYGTFMVSKTSSPQPGDLPNVPPDVRKAAPTVLSNLLADSQHSTTPMHSRTPRLEGSEPAPSGVSRTSTRPHSRLDRIHQRLTAPTRQQEIDSAFSLTTAEYASLTNMDSVPNHERHLPDHYESRSLRPRRVLGESLSHTPDEHSQNSKAEVYTRSLLWEQIPADVIKQFREMVRDHDEIEARQRQERQNNEDMNAYKLET